MAASEGTGLHVSERGAGRPVLMLQGFGYASWAWRLQATAVAQVARAVLLDNRGAGLSDAPPGPYTVAPARPGRRPGAGRHQCRGTGLRPGAHGDRRGVAGTRPPARVVPVANTEGLLKRFPHAELVTMNGCGHLRWLERPHVVTRLLVNVAG